MNFKDFVPFMEAIPEEYRLVRRAKSGDSEAFVELYDAYGDDIYRYVYFRVLSDVAAEGITSYVFRYAWEHLDSYRKKNSSFVTWLYEILRNQVIAYYRANLRTDEFNIGVISVAADYHLNKEAQDRSNLEAWGSHLQLLAADPQQSLLQLTALLIMRRYLDYLVPRRSAKPSPTFNAYTRAWLTRYLQFHVRQPKRAPIVERAFSYYGMLTGAIESGALTTKLSPIKERAAATFASLTQSIVLHSPSLSMAPIIERASSAYASLTQNLQLRVPRPRMSPFAQRMSLTYAMLIATLLVTGTAQAQSALPGDPLYGWKRTSEQAWVTFSPDPLGTNIILANRRLDEWIAVKKDPARSAGALDDYVHAVAKLNSSSDKHARERVAPALLAQKEQLSHSGLPPAQLVQVLAVADIPSPTLSPTQAAITTAAAASPATQVPTQAPSTVTQVVTAAPTTPATEVPTEVVPTETPTATEVVPTETPTATEVVPTETPTATEVVPTETPTATEVPTEVPPTATDVPTEIVPLATDTLSSLDAAPVDAPTPTDTPIVSQ